MLLTRKHLINFEDGSDQANRKHNINLFHPKYLYWTISITFEMGRLSTRIRVSTKTCLFLLSKYFCGFCSNTMLHYFPLSVRVCTARHLIFLTYIIKGINAMLIIRGPIKPYIFWIKIILAIFLAKTRPDKTNFSALTSLTIDFDAESALFTLSCSVLVLFLFLSFMCNLSLLYVT